MRTVWQPWPRAGHHALHAGSRCSGLLLPNLDCHVQVAGVERQRRVPMAAQERGPPEGYCCHLIACLHDLLYA